MPLSDYDSCKRASIRQCEELTSTNTPATGYHGNCFKSTGSILTSNEQIYYPSPYASSRITTYECGLISDGHHHYTTTTTPANMIAGGHTYDVPIKKVFFAD